MDVIWPVVLIFIFISVGTYAWGAWRAAPYVPTKQADVERMLALAKIQPGQKVVDLGAGDARFILTAIKKFQADAYGYEISLIPYWIGKIRLLMAGISPARLQFKDFFLVNLAPADVVMCFLTPAAMKHLVEKFQRELRPGSRIVSYAFSMPGWTLVLKDKPTPKTMSVYVYQR